MDCLIQTANTIPMFWSLFRSQNVFMPLQKSSQWIGRSASPSELPPENYFSWILLIPDFFANLEKYFKDKISFKWRFCRTCNNFWGDEIPSARPFIRMMLNIFLIQNVFLSDIYLTYTIYGELMFSVIFVSANK